MLFRSTNSGSHLSWGEARLPPDPLKIAGGGDYARQAARLGFILDRADTEPRDAPVEVPGFVLQERQLP